MMNGPLPTGMFPNDDPAFFTAVGLTMPRNAWLAASRNGGYGLVKLTVTEYGLLTTDFLYGPSRPIAKSDCSAGLSMRSRVNFTAAALSGVPSENLTPLRSVKVNEVAVLLTVHFVASHG